MGTAIARLSVAMIEPRFGLNVGYVARTMKNFGVNRLLIVGRDALPRSAFRFASHGVDLIQSARHINMKELREQFSLIVGTTAIAGRKGRNPIRKTISPADLAALSMDWSDVVIVLGRDTTGLTAAELGVCDLIVHIDTGTAYPTLNISHALAVILYELSHAEQENVRPVGRQYSDGLLKYFSMMLSLGKYPDHKKKMAIKILGQAVIRSRISQAETVTLMGAFRKVNLALQDRF